MAPKEFSFIKIIYLFMVLFNLLGIALLLDFSSFVEYLLPVDAVIIASHYLAQSIENITKLMILNKMDGKKS